MLKTRLFSLIVIISISASSNTLASSNAYVTDGYGEIVMDDYGYCVRTIDWSKETAMAKCEGRKESKHPILVKTAPVAKPTPEIIPKPKPLFVKKIIDNVPITFHGFFDFDKAVLKDTAKTKLNDYADYLSHNPKTEIKVTGHTDSTGAAVYNQKLSEKRAKSVKTYLELKGIEDVRITAIGVGEKSPRASNKTKEGRAETVV